MRGGLARVGEGEREERTREVEQETGTLPRKRVRTSRSAGVSVETALVRAALAFLRSLGVAGTSL